MDNDKPSMSKCATMQDYRDMVAKQDASAKRRADDKIGAPGKLEWEGDILRNAATAPIRQPAAPAVDAAKLDDLGKLKALAVAVRGLEWMPPTTGYDDYGIRYRGILTSEGDAVMGEFSGPDEDEAQFIAAANPAAILRIAALVAQQAARIAELERARQLDREGMKAALVDLYKRMEKSYDAEPTRRITFMDMEAAHEHVARLGFGGSLDAAIKEGK